MRFLAIFVGFAALLGAQTELITPDRLRAHVKFLASDLLEGRGVGSRGGDLAAEYLAAAFAAAGAKPAGENGTYFQTVPLVGVETQPSSQVTVTLNGKGQSLAYLTEWVGATQRQQTKVDFAAPLVFLGHGITAPEYQWNDYEGIDVKGKIVVLFTSEPRSDDPQLFNGKALTYYGRWTYKYEQARRMGAAGVLIIHTTPTASYGWDVVRTSWGKEDPQVKVDPRDPAPLAFTGWVTEEIGGRLLATANLTVAQALEQAGRRGFRPIPLNAELRGSLLAKVRPIETRNVIAKIEGTDKKDEAVIFSAHYDHLGVGQPANGDAIYNGAADNATGCALIVEVARAWAALPNKPRRTALFLAVTGEESGLRGSEYYAQNPVFPPKKTALGLNFDMFLPFGRTRSIVAIGSERTTAYPLLEEVVRRFGKEIVPDPRPEAGSYYRSDHFSFAKIGIPAFSVGMGNQLLSKPGDAGAQMVREWLAKNYHQPSDEYRDDWDFSGIEEMTRFGFTLGLNAANAEKLFTWKPGDEFLAARER